MDAELQVVEFVGRKVWLRRRESYAIVVICCGRCALLLEGYGEKVVRCLIVATPLIIIGVEELWLLILSNSIVITDGCSSVS